LVLMLSLYIHIPFCNHKCKYCSFFVVPENDELIKPGSMEVMKSKYLDSLRYENLAWREKIGDKQLRTIYIGGGTPFQL
jgi:oxygen-independent coproporphyrinogen III oxidase